MTYYFLVAPDTIDEDLLEVMRSKKNLSDFITDGRFNRDEFLGKRNKSRDLQIKISWPGGENT